jgi:hypothetical protein
MPRMTRSKIASILVSLLFLAASGGQSIAEVGFVSGSPGMKSMSALSFGPDSVLFVGDGKGGAVYALDLADSTDRGKNDPVEIKNLEEKIAAFLGTTAAEVMIHDMAVNPASQNIYLAVSRGRARWNSAWLLPNDIADAGILLKVNPEGKISNVNLDNVSYSKALLPNPVDASKTHKWKKGTHLRADTITDLQYKEGILYVAGLSNEEFSSTMWKIPYPFKAGVSATTLESFHGAHGEYETHAPIRTFVPYALNNEDYILAAYLCTPLTLFRTSDISDGKHVRGRTIAEFGSGNYPLDMLIYQKNGKDKLLIANSNLPFIIVDTEDIASYKGAITTEAQSYVEGVKHEPRSGTGVQQIDSLNAEYILALQRLPGGTMNMVSLPIRRF